nr:immunoglobulin light chain junction region [Macaca mulatta]
DYYCQVYDTTGVLF